MTLPTFLKLQTEIFLPAIFFALLTDGVLMKYVVFFAEAAPFPVEA